MQLYHCYVQASQLLVSKLSSDIDWMLNNLSLFETLIGRAAGLGYIQNSNHQTVLSQLHAKLCLIIYKACTPCHGKEYYVSYKGFEVDIMVYVMFISLT